jgi:hypothetical protein
MHVCKNNISTTALHLTPTTVFPQHRTSIWLLQHTRHPPQALLVLSHRLYCFFMHNYIKLDTAPREEWLGYRYTTGTLLGTLMIAAKIGS